MGVHWKDWCWNWNCNTLAAWCEELTHWKRLWCWERLRAEGEGDDRGWDGWMASPIQWTWVWWTPGVGDEQGGLACCGSWGRRESDRTERLNWTESLESTIFNSLKSFQSLFLQVFFLHPSVSFISSSQTPLIWRSYLLIIVPQVSEDLGFFFSSLFFLSVL